MHWVKKEWKHDNKNKCYFGIFIVNNVNKQIYKKRKKIYEEINLIIYIMKH